MSKNSDFWKKNFTWMHLVAMAVGLLLAMLYWYKAGQFSDNILRKSPVLMALWGLATGYILIDLVRSSKNRQDKNE
jgi:cobalamin synthase